MVRMEQLNETSWVFQIIEETAEPPQILASGRIIAASKEGCLETIAELFKVMGRSLQHKGTSASIEVFDATTDELTYADLSPELERHDI